MKWAQVDEGTAIDITGYEIDPERGFLSSPELLGRLPEPFSAWESAALRRRDLLNPEGR